jgi:serine/threonine protein kinase
VWSATSTLDSSTKTKILDSFPSREPILRQSAEAVAFLHSFGIIHRNIKPNKLLFAQVAPERYLVKLTDMKLSKNFILGPPNSMDSVDWSESDRFGWIAPEMLKFGSILDNKTDCFLLGYLFFYVLTGGKYPYDEVPAYQKNIFRGYAESLTNDALKNEQIQNLILRMLEVERTDRPTVKEVLEDNYFQVINCYDLYKEGTKPGMCYIFNQQVMVNAKVSLAVAACLLF